MAKTILIAGGSGLIGTFLTRKLLAEGYEVRILTRNKDKVNDSDTFFWDPDQSLIDDRAFKGADILINLSGASLSGARWTASRKRILWESRIRPAELLADAVNRQSVKLKCYIGASAVGIFGDRGDDLLLESTATSGNDFLSSLCQAWEMAHMKFEALAERVVIIRIGVVLSNLGGALPELKRSVVLGIGAFFGSGRQYISWVHPDDLVEVFSYLIGHDIRGVVHAVSPEAVTNRTFTRILTGFSKGPGWLIPLPSFLLRLVLGRMADVVLFSQRVVPSVLIGQGFTFKYENLENALENLRSADKNRGAAFT